MIVREIKYKPELLDNFDWFNDYEDTRRWAIYSCPELVYGLDKGYEKWRKEHEDNNL
jgi:hypothetical protein